MNGTYKEKFEVFVRRNVENFFDKVIGLVMMVKFIIGVEKYDEIKCIIVDMIFVLIFDCVFVIYDY